MELWQLILIVGTLLAATVSFIWSATKISYFHKQGIQPKNAASDAINQGIAQAFTEEFRDELRQRARVKFDQIMQENSMLLQQDVRVSVSRVNEFMKNEILSALQQEMAKHQESVSQTKQMFNETVTKSQYELQQQVKQEIQAKVDNLDQHFVEVIKKYLSEAVGDTLNSDQQVALVVDRLNARKAEIIEDIRRYGG